MALQKRYMPNQGTVSNGEKVEKPHRVGVRVSGYDEEGKQCKPYHAVASFSDDDGEFATLRDYASRVAAVMSEFALAYETAREEAKITGEDEFEVRMTFKV